MNSKTFLVLALALSPTIAAAQEGSSVPVKDRQGVTFGEVERGVYLGARAGVSFLMNAPYKGPFSPGQQVGVEVGVDLGERLSLAVGVSFAANRADGTYTGKDSTGAASGDYSMVVPSASLKANLVGLNDGQGVKRTYFYLRGGGGYVLFAPKALLPDSDILVFAGPGVEYYTRLRHFSIGLEVTGSYLITAASFGFAVMPNLRYAF